MGWNLRETLPAVRSARGLTQAQLAERAGLRRTDVNAIEKGRVQVGAQRLDRLATALEVSRLELVPEAEADEPGRLLQRRLEELEAARAADRRHFDRAVRAMTARLAALEEDLALRGQREDPPTKEARR